MKVDIHEYHLEGLGEDFFLFVFMIMYQVRKNKKNREGDHLFIS